jgi:putative phosphoesterase
MRLGILSDSHGESRRVRAAMDVFDQLNVTVIVHCGDVGGEDVLAEMVGRDCHFVWGNTDEPTNRVFAFLETAGIEPPRDVPLELRLRGKLIHVFHGHEPEFRRALTSTDADYILHGHTHTCRDERIAGARVINPGALQRARRYTVAVLDLDTDLLTFHEIEP